MSASNDRSSRLAASPVEVERSGGPVPPRLTARESQVLYWVSMGKTNEEVSEIVGAKPLTIKKHLEHIYDKLGVPNRTAAARMAAGERIRATRQVTLVLR